MTGREWGGLMLGEEITRLHPETLNRAMPIGFKAVC